MSSWSSVPEMGMGNSGCVPSLPFGQGLVEEKYTVFPQDLPVQSGSILKQSEVLPADNTTMSRPRSMSSNFGSYPSHMILNHAIARMTDHFPHQVQQAVREKCAGEFRQTRQASGAYVQGEGDGGRSAIASRKNKRVIKNRESAARSRARKQAYTNQLENEVKQLREENYKLKESLKKMQGDLIILHVAKDLPSSSSKES